jgi:hypothetical protein
MRALLWHAYAHCLMQRVAFLGPFLWLGHCVNLERKQLTESSGRSCLCSPTLRLLCGLCCQLFVRRGRGA